MNLKKRFKAYYYSLVILILLLASFLTLPNAVAFSASGVTITIDSPSANALLNTTSVVISGTFTDSVSSNPLFSASENSNPISDSQNNSSEWSIDGTNGKWSFTKTLSEGTHTLTVDITDQSTGSANITFTIDTKRPYISNSGMVLPGNTVQSGEDLTSVSPDAKIRFTVADDQPMTGLVNKIGDTNNPYNPINVVLGSTVNTAPTPLSGSTIINDLGLQSGKYVYDITFTPSQPLKLNQTYFAYLDPGLLDDSNGPVYAKFFKFTTKTNTVWDDIDDKNHDSSNPHGHYQLNTNMCAACHSSHVNSPYEKDGMDPNSNLDPSREGGSYLVTFKDELKDDPSKNYCMACHDGTTNAPIIDGINSNYHHDNPADYDSTNGTNKLKEASSCTSCHNPHLEWSAENPNLLINHYVYTHNAADQGQNGLSNLVVDSLDKPCSICHEDDSIHDSSTNTTTSIFDFNTTNYQILSYKKSLTAEGAITAKATDPNQNTVLDYSLCLRCHNANKSNTNIEKYYIDTASGHNFALPSDDGGSKLNGPLPCAECHVTHGSNNIKMLRSQLGNILTDSKFTTSGQNWDATNERSFCLKCHNNSTEIYGKTGEFKLTNSAGTDITGHQTGDTQACSTCHGTGATDAEKALSAAHAPKKTP